LAELPELTAVSARQLQSLIEQDMPALDVRPPDEFASGHVPGSINIGLSGQFASWTGSLLGLKARPILIADSSERIDEARIRLARVGIEELTGYLQDGIAGWTKAGFRLAQLPQVTVHALKEQLHNPRLRILDVRREGEWQAGHMDSAQLWPLDRFKDALPDVAIDTPIAVHCKSGYRSTIACSLLMRAGFENVTNVVGGFDAWEAARLPVVREAAMAAK
jgi:hydroxyacylglutathione hydrolase